MVAPFDLKYLTYYLVAIVIVAPSDFEIPDLLSGSNSNGGAIRFQIDDLLSGSNSNGAAILFEIADLLSGRNSNGSTI